MSPWDSLPNEVLLQIFSSFRGSDFYGAVLVNRSLNQLLTAEMYRHLKLFLPRGAVEDEAEDSWDGDALVDLFENFSVDSEMPSERCEKCDKGSGALLKRTFKENPELARLVKVLTVVGQDLKPEDIMLTEDGMAEFPVPPDAAFRGVRNLLQHLTELESLAFQGDSAQLSAFIYSVPRHITSLSIERLSRLQFGDVYTFRNLRRLTVRAPPVLSGNVILSKSTHWETMYAIRMLLEQNSSTLEELVLGNWNVDMLFQGYSPRLPRLSTLAVELAAPKGESTLQQTQQAGWPWFADLLSSVRGNLKVFICCSLPHTADENALRQLSKVVDWKSLHGGRRVKRKSRFRGHKLSSIVDWATGEPANSTLLVELLVRRQRVSVYSADRQ